MEPYLLKEYQSRWYIVGFVKGMNNTRTFGIDRISDLVLTDQVFKPTDSLDAQQLFKDTIGLTYSVGSVQQVVLSFTPLQGRYVKALPLHDSQIVLKDDDTECLIRLDVIPNFELTQKILMLGPAVKVISPDWLIDEVKNALTSTLNQYS